MLDTPTFLFFKNQEMIIQVRECVYVSMFVFTVMYLCSHSVNMCMCVNTVKI